MGLWYSKEKAKIIDEAFAKMQDEASGAFSLSKHSNYLDGTLIGGAGVKHMKKNIQSENIKRLILSRESFI